MDDLLKAIGLVSVDAVYPDAERWFERTGAQSPALRTPELRRIRRLLAEFGMEHFRTALSKAGAPLSMQEFLQRNLPSPSMMTSDCEQFHVTADSDLLNSANGSIAAATRMALRAGRGLDFGFKDYVY